MNIVKSFIILLLFAFLSGKTFSYTGELNKSYDLPCKFPTGLTFDGKNLWFADRKTDSIYCMNGETGEILRKIGAPAYWPSGLAWDGKNLWCADIKGGIPLAENYKGLVYMLSPDDGTILRTIPAPCNNPKGLTWDGKYLWCTDNSNEDLIQFDPNDGTTIKTLKAPSVDPQGITWDGKYLWVTDRRSDKIYMVEPDNGWVILVTESPGPYPTGLAFDGEMLWNVDYETNKINQLIIHDDELYLKSDMRKSKVQFTHQTTNFGPGEVKSLDVYFAIPIQRVSQMVDSEIKYTPNYKDIVTDKWGQKTAHFHFENIKPGEIKEITAETEMALWAVRYFIFPEKVKGKDKVPKEIKDKYLENNDKYQYNHPLIKETLAKVIGNEQNPYWICRKIYHYLIDNMYYEMTGGWNTAPTVLARGNGSCSEYSFVYIAMCRAAGIPARYVGSVVVRGDEASMDDVFHRWVEVYLPGYGWIPVDPSGGDEVLPADQADSFGALSNRFYITTQSGGGSETMGWTYNCNEFYTTAPKTNVVIEYFGDWEPMKE